MIIDYENKEEEYYSHSRPEMEETVPQGIKSLLDVGCSSGNFGYLVKQKRNIEVWGIEPNENAAKLAESKLDKVICGILNKETDLNGKKFDCIVFNDVLEHLIEPGVALVDCKKYLTGNGCVVSSIPNLRYFEAIKHILLEKDFKYSSSGIFDATHLRFFTKKSIERMFLECGYQIMTLKGINSIKANAKEYAKFKRLNFLFRNSLEDMEFLQFAVVAFPK